MAKTPTGTETAPAAKKPAARKPKAAPAAAAETAPAADAKAEAMGAASQVAASTDSGICLDCLRKAAHFGSPTVIRE